MKEKRGVFFFSCASLPVAGDTDSSYHFARHEKLEDNVRPGMRGFFERTRKRVFLDTASEIAQAGKMEEERIYTGGGVFRQNKSYIVYDEGGKKDVKFKGVSRSAREALAPEHFAPPGTAPEDLLVSSWRLGPTPSGELVLNVSSKVLPSRVNYKRRALVLTLG